ncbi:MAG: helix-turn-helix domain-containing protein [Deltaproteobacteria bacterium]|nr:MAG: helix-turn-helix domain-containing protein [Deltaproteobacteria bacterium]TMQ25409.1 MAG: helix-turn-helix domain-containing protein [Deltaproteobacteria bacterium]
MGERRMAPSGVHAADRRGDRIRERIRADHRHRMEETMKCPQCRTPMQSRRENYRWDASGLSNVVLIDVEVRRCPACGEHTVVIPRIEELHRTLAMAVISRPGRLAPQEIRFLRKWLGWSGQDFARHFGVTPTTVSRWESLEDPSPMGGTAERLLRLAVAHGQPAEQYPVSRLAEIDDSQDASPRLIAFKSSRGGWEQAAA